MKSATSLTIASTLAPHLIATAVRVRAELLHRAGDASTAGTIQLFGRNVEWIEWQEGIEGSLLVFLAISSVVYGIKKLLRGSSSAPV